MQLGAVLIVCLLPGCLRSAQGAMLDDIEANMVRTSAKTKDATRELRQADKSQRSSRNKVLRISNLHSHPALKSSMWASRLLFFVGVDASKHKQLKYARKPTPDSGKGFKNPSKWIHEFWLPVLFSTRFEQTNTWKVREGCVNRVLWTFFWRFACIALIFQSWNPRIPPWLYPMFLVCG